MYKRTNRNRKRDAGVW